MPYHLAMPPIFWSGRRGSNSRPPPWQGGVLPLNYFRKMAGVLGFEPRHDGIKIRCLTAWLYPKRGRPMGIEPTNAGITIRCVNHFATIAMVVLYSTKQKNHLEMGRPMGIEPTNAGITIRCVNHFATTATIYK